jgi:hypothetical protein
VNASQYFYNYAPARSVLMLAGTDFPVNLGPRYGVMLPRFGGDTSPDLFDLGGTPTFRQRSLGVADVVRVAAAIREFGSSGYLVFSSTQDKYAVYSRETTAASLASLERAISRSPLFSLWYSTADARIYRLHLAISASQAKNANPQSAPTTHPQPASSRALVAQTAPSLARIVPNGIGGTAIPPRYSIVEDPSVGSASTAPVNPAVLGPVGIGSDPILIGGAQARQATSRPSRGGR